MALLKRRRKDVRMIRQYRAINNKPKRLGGFFFYFGGDSRWANKIVDMLPMGRKLVEVFGGGASVTVNAMLRNKYQEYVLNDKDPLVYNGYLQVINGNPMYFNEIRNKYLRLLNKVLNGRKEQVRRELLRKIIKCRKHGICSDALVVLTLSVPIRKDNLLVRTNFRSLSRKVKEWNEISRLTKKQGLRVYNKDWKNIVKKEDSPNTVFYLDPPHIDHKNDGTYWYSFSVDDARRLGELLTRIKGRFVLKINPEDWVKVYSKVLRPIRDKLRVKRVKYVVNFARTGRGKVKREMVFVIKE